MRSSRNPFVFWLRCGKCNNITFDKGICDAVTRLKPERQSEPFPILNYYFFRTCFDNLMIKQITGDKPPGNKKKKHNNSILCFLSFEQISVPCAELSR